MFRNIYKYRTHVYCAVGPSRHRCEWLPTNVTVVVELASRIQDLVQNKSGELLAHGVDPIGRINFIRDSTHLSFRTKELIY